MGIFDKIKDIADEHADKVEDAIDKVAEVVDEKTGGKYAKQIETGAEKAKDFVGDDKSAAPKDQEPPSRLTP